jgi:hypothetical protein
MKVILTGTKCPSAPFFAALIALTTSSSNTPAPTGSLLTMHTQSPTEQCCVDLVLVSILKMGTRRSSGSKTADSVRPREPAGNVTLSFSTVCVFCDFPFAAETSRLLFFLRSSFAAESSRLLFFLRSSKFKPAQSTSYSSSGVRHCRPPEILPPEMHNIIKLVKYLVV